MYLVLVQVGRANFVCGHDSSADDLDGAVTGAVAGSHLGVQLLHGRSEGGITELLVHVVDATAGDVAEPDAVGLDDAAVLLEDLVDGKDLTSHLLQLVQTGNEVPEARFGGDLVGGEDLHAEDVGLRVLGRGFLATHNAEKTDRHD